MSSKVGDTSENKGFMGKAMDSATKILELPDMPETETGRRIARIAADILIIGLGVGLFCALNYSNGFSGLANPSFTTLMSLPMTLVIMGVGLGMLIKDILGEKHQRTAAKVAACLTPVLLLAGTAALVYAGFHTGLTGISINSYYMAGLILLPLTLFSAAYAIKKVSEKDPPKFATRCRQYGPKGTRRDARRSKGDIKMTTFARDTETKRALALEREKAKEH